MGEFGAYPVLGPYQRINAFYEKMLSSENSISKTVRHHKADNMEKSYASNSILMYHMIDVIAFTHGDRWTESFLPQKSFLPLSIPVRCSPHIWNSTTKFMAMPHDQQDQIR
jgi:hypothetical protein